MRDARENHCKVRLRGPFPQSPKGDFANVAVTVVARLNVTTLVTAQYNGLEGKTHRGVIASAREGAKQSPAWHCGRLPRRRSSH